MSRADELRAQFEAEIEVAELEDQLAALKAKPGDGAELREVKDQLREARQTQREAREEPAETPAAKKGRK